MPAAVKTRAYAASATHIFVTFSYPRFGGKYLLAFLRFGRCRYTPRMQTSFCHLVIFVSAFTHWSHFNVIFRPVSAGDLAEMHFSGRLHEIENVHRNYWSTGNVYFVPHKQWWEFWKIILWVQAHTQSQTFNTLNVIYVNIESQIGHGRTTYITKVF